MLNVKTNQFKTKSTTWHFISIFIEHVELSNNKIEKKMKETDFLNLSKALSQPFVYFYVITTKITSFSSLSALDFGMMV